MGNGATRVVCGGARASGLPCPPLSHTHVRTLSLPLSLPLSLSPPPPSPKVLGHAKTVTVLLGGWALFGDVISGRQAFGMAVAVAGMVGYGLATAPPEKAAGVPASAPVGLTTSPRARSASLSPASRNGGGAENAAPGGGSPGKLSPARAAGPPSQPLVDFNKLRVAAAGSALFGPMLKAVGLVEGAGKDDDGFKIRAAHGGGGSGAV